MLNEAREPNSQHPGLKERRSKRWHFDWVSGLIGGFVGSIVAFEVPRVTNYLTIAVNSGDLLQRGQPLVDLSLVTATATVVGFIYAIRRSASES